MAGLYTLGARLFDARTGVIAALLYSIFQPWAVQKDLAFNGEVLMNLPIAWAYAIALRPRDSGSRPEVFGSGALLALAFLLKQPAAISAVPLGIYLLLPSYRKAYRLRKLAWMKQAGYFVAGFFATLAAMALVLWKDGILAEAFYWTISAHAIQHVFWSKGILNSLAFAGCCMPLLIGSIFSFRSKFQIWAGRDAERTALLLLVVASIIGVLAGAKFYFHYYIQLILPLALVAAPFYARLCSEEIVIKWLRPNLIVAWLGLTVLAFFLTNLHGAEFRHPPRPSAQYLLDHSLPGDRIFVWGQHPGIYLEAKRRPACRYITTFPLSGYIFGGKVAKVDSREWIRPWAWTNLQSDFARNPPAYIVDTEAAPGARYPAKDFPILAELLQTKYEQVAETDDAIIYRRRAGL
jgi:4-amino-4-deoxy-L-arabinose transferase-like glycosyltransferase